MRLILSTLVLAAVVTQFAYAQTAPTPAVELLRELEVKKVRVRQQVERIPEHVERETARIMSELDDFWKSDRANQLARDFIESARTKAKDVHLDDKYGTLETLWAEYKSLASSRKLEEIATDYINDLTAAIVREQDAMFEDLREGMEQSLAEAFVTGQSNITASIDESIASDFKYWPGFFTTIPIKDTPPIRTPDSGELPGTPGLPTMIGGGLIAASLLKKITGKIAQKIQVRVSRKAAAKATKKVAGKVAGKFIPFAGVILLAFDAVDAATARSRMEEFLREIVLEEYAAEMSPMAIWNGDGNGDSIRAVVASDVRNQMTAWSKQATDLALKFLETAILIENPTFKTFVEGKAEEGWDLSLIADYCHELTATFGPLCSRAPSVDILVNMMVLTPSRPDLRRLCEHLGGEVFAMFDEHGQSLLTANSDLGPDNIVGVLRRNQDWKAIHRAFNQYLSRTSSQQAHDGFFACVEEGLDLSGVGNPAFFEAVGRHRSLFSLLVRSNATSREITSILADTDTAELLEGCIPFAPELVLPLVRGLPQSQLSRYGRSGLTSSFMESFAICKGYGVSAQQFTEHLRKSDSLIDIYQTTGADGIDIWLSYVSPGSGAVHSKWAAQALHLYEKGCPKDICKDKDNLSASAFTYSLPGGPQVYAAIYPWLDKAPWLSKAVMAIAIMFLIMLAVRITRSGLRIHKRRRTGKPKRTKRDMESPAVPNTSGGKSPLPEKDARRDQEQKP